MSFQIQRGNRPELAPLAAGDTPAVGAIIYRAIARAFRDHGLPEPIADEAQGERLAQLYLALDPEGCLVARRDGVPIGAGFLHVRDEVASLGPVVIDPPHQSQGAGTHLFEALADRAARCASTRLFVDAFNVRAFGIPLRRGFEPRDLGLRLVALGGLRGPGMLAAIAPAPVRELTIEDVPAVARFDAGYYGGSRERDLGALLASGGRGLVAEEDGAVRGYLCGRVAGSLATIGPGSAESAELLAKLLARLGEELGANANIFLTYVLASQSPVVAAAFAMGFRVTNLSVYMVRGAYTPVKRPAVIGCPPDVV
jgi:GNAT superfamily N-acetyltransferase